MEDRVYEVTVAGFELTVDGAENEDQAIVWALDYLRDLFAHSDALWLLKEDHGVEVEVRDITDDIS